jgi:carboxypeptidase C (cathepsin A)
MSLFAEEADEKESAPPVTEERVQTHHQIRLGDREIAYTATAGTLPLSMKDGKVQAAMFYVSYTKEASDDNLDESRKRPITFCFNGGPGAASVWLHMGVFGPKRVLIDPENVAPPYTVVDNIYSLLDVTDLIFIDPISTGFSKAVPGEDPKQFHGVDEDVQSIAEFIRLWTSKNQRWDAPKYLAGESYGTLRAASLALKLHDQEFYYLDGIILISSLLTYQSVLADEANDLPYILFFPTYTTTAWYHHKLPEELQSDLEKARKEAEDFALNELGPALLKGDLLEETERQELIKKMARLTGLSETYIDRANLRVPQHRFCKELLRNEGRTVGRMDSRFLGFDSDLNGCNFEYDPSMEVMSGAFSASFNQYIRADLKWDKSEGYKLLADVFPWNWGKASNSYYGVGSQLREAMAKNPNLKIFVASGYFDLATPYCISKYTFNHLNLVPALKKNLTLRYYDAGHMMYIYEPALIQLKRDLAEFYKGK